MRRYLRLVVVLGLAAAGAGCASGHASVVHRRPPRERRYALIFASSRDGRYQIYGRAADGATEVRLTYSTADDVEPAVSRDGRWVAFVRARASSAPTGTLWIMRSDGSGARRLLGGVSAVSAPTFSPDGRRLAVALGRQGARGLDILPLTGGPGRVLHLGDRWISDPAWSPDGRSIAVSVTADIEWVPEIIRADGSAERVFDVPGNVMEMRWSPDGRELAYAVMGARGGIFVARADGSHRHEVVTVGGETLQGLAWEPDGRHLVYTSSVESVGLRSVDVRSDASRPLGPASRNDIEPAVAPPDAVTVPRVQPGAIAFTSDRDGMTQIYTMDGAGREQTRQFTPGAVTYAVWSPVGQLAVVRLAYHADVPRSGVEVSSVGSATLRPLITVDGGYVVEVAWSPAGDRIALVLFKDGTYTAEVLGAGGGRPTVAARGPREPLVRWYADDQGLMLVLHGATTDVEWERPVGSAPHVMAHGPAAVEGADPAPAGDAVVAAFFNKAGGDLYVFERRWQRVFQDHGRIDLSPTWSPDGRWIAFWRRRRDARGKVRGPAELAVLPVDGGRVRTLAHARFGRGEDIWYSWDGAQGLVFATNVDGRMQLERVAVSGGPVRLLGDSRSSFGYPAVYEPGPRV